MFVPWQALARVAGRGTVRAAPVPAPRAPARAQIALVAAIVRLQFFASAHRREIEPFLSDYGMYSWTWPSIEAFDDHNARKYRQYRYLVETSGEATDVTDRLRQLPEATDILTDAIDRLRDGEALLDTQREAMRAIVDAYAAAYHAAVVRLDVRVNEQAFDWSRGVFYPKASGAAAGTLDLRSGAFVPASPSAGAL